MGLQFVQTEEAPAAIGPYSQAVTCGDWLFVSGQIPLDPRSGRLVGDAFASQARQALQNVGAILGAAGFGLSDVVSVDVYLTDMERFSEFNRIYEDFFDGHKPARAVVQVCRLPRDAQVEIKCVACRK